MKPKFLKKNLKKTYRSGYNNPSQWNQTTLLKSNSELAKAAINGIVQRKADDAAGCTKLK